MSRSRLVHQAILGERDNSVKDPDLLRSSAILSETARDLELEVVCKRLLEPINVGLHTHRREVVPVHNKMQVSRGVMEAAGDGNAGGEAHILQRSSVCILPYSPCVPRAIGTSDQLANQVAREAHLLRKSDVDRPLRNPIEIGFRMSTKLS